jgi:iron(III) transport system substrate-binding protein
MRHALAALGLMVAAAFAPAHAFEIEEDHRFGPANGVRVVSVLSTTDTEVFRPLIDGFLARNPGLALRYTVASSNEVFKAVAEDSAPYDLVISSAMDLQMKLANDGLALAVPGAGAAAGLPPWAVWRDRLFAVTQEPVVLVLHRDALAGGLPVPRTRRDLVTLLRDHPDRFWGRIGTYDPNLSGAGFLFATQEARQSDAFWRLAEVMGRLDARLYCCTSEMLADLASGRLLLAHNVLGSYATVESDSALTTVEPEDFTLMLLRSALVPVHAPAPALGAELLRFLLSAEGRRLFAQSAGLPPVDPSAFARATHLRPIRLDPGLLVPLDRMMRRQFLDEWTAAMVQP